MTKLLEQAVAKIRELPDQQQDAIAQLVLSEIDSEYTRPQPPHSILDIPAVSLGKIILPLTPHDDLLDEMLEDCQ